MDIVGVSGSPRRGGNSDAVLRHVLEGAGKAGVSSATRIYLSDLDFSSCTGCERCRRDKICTCLDDELTPLYPAVLRAGGLVLVTPVYSYNLTAWMKAFIDRLYCFFDFDDNRPRGWSSRLAGQGRAAALAIVAEQEDPRDLGVAMEALRLPVQALGYEIAGELAVPGVFEPGIVLDHPGHVRKARALGRKLVRRLSG